jgi:hypothetical protein
MTRRKAIKPFFIILALSIFVLTAILVSCNKGTDNGTAEFKFNTQEYTVNIYDQITLQLTGTKEGAAISFTSDDTSVATVNNDGVVIGLTVGRTTITAVMNEKTATCTIIVSSSMAVPSFSTEMTRISLLPGGTYQVNLIAKHLNESIEAEIDFESGNISVATVSPSGKITAVSVGLSTVTITASYRGFTDIVEVFVEVVPDISMQISEQNPFELLAFGEPSQTSKQLTVIMLKENEEDMDRSSIRWSSSDDKIVTVSSDGHVEAVGVGSAVITAEYQSALNPEHKARVLVDVTVKHALFTLQEAGKADLSWDYEDTSKSEYMLLTLPANVPFSVEDILALECNGKNVSKNNSEITQVKKSAFVRGDNMVTVTTAKVIYTFNVKVAQKYLQGYTGDITIRDAAAIKKENIGEYGGKSGVYKFTSVNSTDLLNGSVFTIPLTGYQDFDYAAITLRMDTLKALKVWINWSPEKSSKFTYGATANWMKLYKQDGRFVDGINVNLEDGEWFTLIWDLSKLEQANNLLRIGVTEGGEIYAANLRYFDSEIFDNEIRPVTVAIAPKNINMSIGDSTSIDTAVTYMGQTVNNPLIIWKVHSGTDIVTVDGNGTITALSPGMATVSATYTSPNDGNDIIEYITVNVADSVLESSIKVDISWDFEAGKPLIGNTVAYDFPNELAAYGKTRTDILSIKTPSGELIGDSNAFDKSKLTVGKHNITLNMSDSTIYMAELVVTENYRAIDANTASNKGSVTKTEISTGVYKFVNTATGNDYFTNRIGISIGNTGANNFDYVLIDLKMDTLATLRAMLGYSPEIAYNFKDGTTSSAINLYTKDGVRADGTDVKLQNGEWFTLVLTTSQWGTAGDMLGIGLSAGAAFELKNIRYIKQEIFNDIIKPVSFTLSDYSLDLSLGEEETVTASATYKGEPVAASDISWSVAEGSESIISVVNGKITALATGAAEVIATYTTPDNKTITRKVAVAVINTLENPINVDISWDFTLATPLEGNSVQYDFPAEIAAEGKTRADIASITNLNGVLVGDSSALDKSKLTVGTQLINFNMSDSTVYIVELIVTENYRAIDANNANNKGSVTKTEISTGVYKFVNPTGTDMFANRIGISIGNTGAKNFDYVLIDLKMDTLADLRAILSSSPDIGSTFKEGSTSSSISLYTKDGVLANGADVKLQNGEWFTLVITTSKWGTAGDMLGIGLSKGAAVELKNIRYIKQDIYNDVIMSLGL